MSQEEQYDPNYTAREQDQAYMQYSQQQFYQHEHRPTYIQPGYDLQAAVAGYYEPYTEPYTEPYYLDAYLSEEQEQYLPSQTHGHNYVPEPGSRSTTDASNDRVPDVVSSYGPGTRTPPPAMDSGDDAAIDRSRQYTGNSSINAGPRTQRSNNSLRTGAIRSSQEWPGAARSGRDEAVGAGSSVVSRRVPQTLVPEEGLSIE
ncbi:hypothetical protein EDD21DRAFT_400602 [Dissophora ornata]|nr:hypothetical protein EDD21DRAFT_400602 [Dissophora ornata]